MKALITFALAAALLAAPVHAVTPLSQQELPIPAPAACLLEQQTGALLYEKDAHSRRSIASVTKVMTLLLILEAIDQGSLSWETQVTASAHAAGMGGSQIWLEEGETMSVSELVKCITVVSANDCSVAMAEHLSGSEEAFTRQMNRRAEELGLRNTHFTNCTGLFDEPEHYSSAYDVAVMARALMDHPEIRDYSTIWMDTARNGAFGLNNTNKLIRSYPGATGLKTGFTNGAGYCLAATAQREETAFVAAVLGAETSQQRFDSAAALLNHGFANFSLCDLAARVPLPPVAVKLGTRDWVQPVFPGDALLLLEKHQSQSLRFVPEFGAAPEAPVAQGQELGRVLVYGGQTLLESIPLVAGQAVERLSTGAIFQMLVRQLLCAP